MAVINWTENLSVGHNIMDDQHKQLFGLINSFYEGIRTNSSNVALGKLIKDLKDYTFYHFKLEEALMKKHGYPGYEAQRLEHEKFIKTVQDYEDRLNSGMLIISVEITNYIKKWITDHILGMDKKYSTFFAEKGIN